MFMMTPGQSVGSELLRHAHVGGPRLSWGMKGFESRTGSLLKLHRRRFVYQSVRLQLQNLRQ